MSSPSEEETTRLQAFVDALISWQLTSDHICVSRRALEEIEKLLRDPSKNALLTGRVNKLIWSIRNLINMNLYTHRYRANVPREELILLYRQLSFTLTSLLECDHLIKEATDDSLCQLFRCLMNMAMSKFLTEMNLNFEPILFKLVERSDHTACMIALVRILKTYVAVQYFPIEFQLVIKVDLSELFYHIYMFFERFPMQYWKNQPDDAPMRILKTLMHTVVKQLGSEVLNHLDWIDQPQTAEVVSYLKNAIASRPSG